MYRSIVALLCIAVGGCASASDQSTSLPAAPTAETARVESFATAPARLTWARVNALAFPAPQDDFPRYGSAVRRALWERVYSGGGTELYCRARFSGAEAADQMVNDIELQLEHVYPADSIAEHFNYTNRSCNRAISGTQPSARDQAMCRAAAGDLYNLFPAYGPMNQSRSNLAYAELAGEGTTNERYQDICNDFERDRIGDVAYVEPDDGAQGDIARAIIYMNKVYGLPYASVIADRELLLTWANDDPVDQGERRREERIRALQPGSWNPLVMPRESVS